MRDAALPFVALLLFGLLLMRRGARQRRNIASMQSSVVVGARVMTTSGLYATIVALDDTTATLETGPGQRSTWDRRAVARVLDGPSDGPSDGQDGDAQSARGYPGGTMVATEAADSSPAVALPPPAASGSEPSATPSHAAGADLIAEPPAAPPAGSVPERQPPSDETTPRGPA